MGAALLVVSHCQMEISEKGQSDFGYALSLSHGRTGSLLIGAGRVDCAGAGQ